MTQGVRAFVEERLAGLSTLDPELAVELTAKDDARPLATEYALEHRLSSPATTATDASDVALETLVRSQAAAAPVMVIRDNAITDAFAGDPSEAWRRRVLRRKAELDRIIPSVGRIEVVNHPLLSWVGTGWLVARDIIVTSGHVAREFARDDGTAIVFTASRGARFDNHEEPRPASVSLPIARILWLSDNPDLALLQVDATAAAALPAVPIQLGRPAATGAHIAVVGYPGGDDELDQRLLRSFFGDVYGRKRLAPGHLIEIGRRELQHDCSTLRGNSGSPIIDLESGHAVGLHRAGTPFTANFAIASTVLEDVLRRLATGRLARPAIVKPATEEAPSRALPVDASPDQWLRQARDAVPASDRIANVRLGYRFAGGWITDERVIVIELQPWLDRPLTPQELGVPARIGPLAVTVRTASIDTYLRPRGGLRTESLRAPAVAERIARGHYRRPSHLSLHAVTDTMSAIFHVSPDAGWPTLHDFIGRIDRQLVATMYEFDAEYVRDALLERLSTDRRTLWFVSHHRGESMLRFVETMKARLKGRMHHVWASAGGNDLIFPRAYHIKVAVRDRRELWLSSGNWKQSGQPLLDGSDQRWATFVAGHNREWHAVIDNGALATQLDDYIRYDFDEAQRVPRPEAVAWPDVSVLVPTVEAKAPEVRRFPPYPVARRLTIEPLLTPDNYHRAVAQLLRGARKRIYFQNQALSLLEDENEPAFVELLSLLKARQRDLDVKIIVRDLATYGRPAMETQRQLLERLRDFGFEMQRIKLQRACHTKGIVVDSRIVLLGSHNWTNLGTLYNRDASLVVHDADVARYFEEIFLHDWTTLAHQQIEEPPHVRAPAPGEPVAEGMTSVSLRDILDEHVL